MDFFGNAVNKAKEVFDIACKKTNEVVATGKNKFDIATLENKRSKYFEKLGEKYFNLIKNTEIKDSDIKELVDSIISKNTQIEEIKKQINATKNLRTCYKCGAVVSDSSIYCSECGEKLVFESEE